MKRILVALYIALIAAACGSKPDETEPVKLVANPSELTFDAAGGTKEITITSGIKPTVSCSDSWLTVAEGSYSGTSLTLGVTAKENTGTTARSGNIRVIGDKQSLMIAVKQNVAEVPMSADKTSAAFDRLGGEMEITITSSTQPAISGSVPSWCLASLGSIDSDKKTTLTIATPANRSAEAKSGEITVSCGSQSVKIAVSLEAYQTPATVSAPVLTQEMVFAAMAPGWNMGNHMDAIANGIAGETIWGNSKCTQATMDGVKAAGFKAVRIPVTWTGHIGDAPAYRLEEKWLARVEEIVGYAEKAGLVAIVNTHHDESYFLDIAKAYNNPTQNEKVKDEIFSVWAQIAQRFKDKGEWLIMESFNEIQDGGWGWSDAFKSNPQPQYNTLNGWNQVFVDAVRSTGGNNATRWLGIPGYAASPGFTIAGLVLPNDYTSANRMMVGVHDYDPYYYTINEELTPQWGHTADPAKRCSDRDEENVVAVFDQLKEAYLDKDIPVYIGEMGCSRHNAADLPYQYYYFEYFCKAAADRGLPGFLWDNGASGAGSEKHGYIDHGTGVMFDDYARECIGRIVKAATTTDPDYTLESVYNSAP